MKHKIKPHTSAKNIFAADELQQWYKQCTKRSKSNFIMLSVFSLITLSVAVFQLANVIIWDKQIQTYDHVQGTILKNETITRGSGKHRRTHLVLEYTYTYKNKQYNGSKTVYDTNFFPPKQPGSTHEIIVNPEDPSDSAAMIHYAPGAVWTKYIHVIIFGAIFIILAIITVKGATVRKLTVPDKLKDFMKQFPPPEQQAEGSDSNNDFDQYYNTFSLQASGKLSVYRNNTYYINNNMGTGSTLLIIFMMLPILPIAITGNPVGWIILLVYAGIFFINRPKKTIFELDDGRIFRHRSFHPYNLKEKNICKIDEITHLTVEKYSTPNKKHISIALFAVTSGNECFMLSQCTAGKIEKLLDIAADTAILLNKQIIFKA